MSYDQAFIVFHFGIHKFIPLKFMEQNVSTIVGGKVVYGVLEAEV